MTNNTKASQSPYRREVHELTMRIRDELFSFMADYQFDPDINREDLVKEIKLDLDLWVKNN